MIATRELAMQRAARPQAHPRRRHGHRVSSRRRYFTSETGRVRVLEAQPLFTWLADNDLTTPCLATPAIAAGAILFRTKSQVISVGRTE